MWSYLNRGFTSPLHVLGGSGLSTLFTSTPSNSEPLPDLPNTVLSGRENVCVPSRRHFQFDNIRFSRVQLTTVATCDVSVTLQADSVSSIAT